MSAAQNRFKQAKAPSGGRAATSCLGTSIVEARHWARSTVQLRARTFREPSAAALAANVGAP